jgi:methionyl-tRNA synthetase
MIGKDILLHHAVYWPIMLRAMGLPMPETVLAHGWWMIGERKIGKRDRQQHEDEALREAAVAFAANGDREAKMRAACDVLMCSPRRPIAGPGAWLWLIDEFGLDPLRYFLARDMILGLDSQISLAQFVTRINTELANDLGNMLSRSTKLAEANLGGRLPHAPRDAMSTEERAIAEAGDALVEAMRSDVENYATQQFIERVLAWIRDLNGMFAALEPWKLAKEGRGDDLARVLRTTCDALAHAAALLAPVMPGKMAELLQALGFEGDAGALRVGDLRFGALLPAEIIVASGHNLFPRIEVIAMAEAEIAAAGIDLASLSASGKKPAQTAPREKPKKAAPAENSPEAGQKPSAEARDTAGVALIGIDDFTRVQLRTAEVLEAARIDGTDKLLKLKIRVGGDERPLVAGIAQHYAPEALVGRRIVIVANLKPAKIRGHESHGMLLAAKADGKLTLVTTDDPQFTSGASVG